MGRLGKAHDSGYPEVSHDKLLQILAAHRTDMHVGKKPRRKQWGCLLYYPALHLLLGGGRRAGYSIVNFDGFLSWNWIVC